MNFKTAIDTLFMGMVVFNTNPYTGFRVAKLPDEDQVRIYPIGNCGIHSASDPLPTVGRFVAAAVHPELDQLTLAFGAFPEDGGESQHSAALAYNSVEYIKGAHHAVHWINDGVVPVADVEYRMKHEKYSGKKLSEVPYEEIYIGMELISAINNFGKVIRKTDAIRGEDDNWIAIQWENGKYSEDLHRNLSEVTVR